MTDLPLPEALIDAAARAPYGEAAWLRLPEFVRDEARETAIDRLTAALAFRDESGHRAVWSAEEVEPLITLLEESRREHYCCDDCWYSCPKSIGGCCDDSKGEDCTCGADAWNARVDAALARVRGPEPAEYGGPAAHDADAIRDTGA